MSDENKSKIPLHAPWIERDEVKAVREVLESGNLSTGWQVEEFEREIAEYIGCTHAVVVSSATAGLHLALIVAGISPGDEVIMPAFTFPGAITLPHLLGAKTVFADVEYNTYTINPKKVEEAVTDKTRAIVPVSPFGLPYDLEAIRHVADKYGLLVIGDNAGSFGAKYWNQRLGSAECDLHDSKTGELKREEGHVVRGKGEDLSVFSFHATKVLTTGEGGCVCTENSDWAVQMRMLRDHCSLYRADPEPKKRFMAVGFNYRMSDIAAALGRVQLAKMDEMIYRRREAASIYTQMLEEYNPAPRVSTLKTPVGTIPIPEKQYNIVTPYEPEGCFHTFQRYVIYLTFHNAVLVRNQMRAKGIEVKFGYYNAPDEPVSERLGIYKRCPISRACFHHTVALPIYHTITREEQQRVVETLAEVLKLS
ncbi:MAG: DegT/DnrJ/EryC1/StrS family aminotransferase [Candidatus Bathyarchaeia archaeon]